MAPQTRIKAALIDLDGTLVDSNDAHARAWVAACAREGFEVSFDEVRGLIGMGGELLLESLLSLSPDSEMSRRIQEERKRIFQEQELGQIQVFPEVRPLLQRLREQGVRVVVASSSTRDDLQGLLDRADIADLVDEATSADDIETAKPARDVITAALHKAGADAKHAVLLGDTPYDVKAGQSAGVPVVALRCGGWEDRDLRGAAAIYDDPADLYAHLDESPLGEA